MTGEMKLFPKTKSSNFLRYITVEPTLLLYMLAFMITTVIEQEFFIFKACTVNHNLNNTVCSNLTDPKYKSLIKEVQITVSDFHLINDIAGHAGQIILALFMGAFSDKRGRKIPLLIGLFGKLYYSSMIVVNTLMDTWPVEYIVYTATLPMAFTGADVAIFASAYSYLVDISSPESRTMRVTLLEVSYLAMMPIGIALGSYLFRKVVNKSYTIMFSINVTLLVLSFIYSSFRLKWRTNSRQKPLSEAPNKFTDFFDYKHVVQTVKTLFKKRSSNRRTYLLLLIVMMACYTFQRDEKNMSYLYLQLLFDWTVGQNSNLRTYQSALQVIMLLLAIPFLSKFLGWRDSVIIMLGAIANSVARIFFAAAQVGWIFYVGGTFASLGPLIAPVIRSMVSKLVSNTEKGKTFAVLSVADNAIPIVSGVLYSKLYNFTIHDHPSAIFYLTMATQLSVFILALYIHIRAKDEDLIHEDEGVRKSLNGDRVQEIE